MLHLVPAQDAPSSDVPLLIRVPIDIFETIDTVSTDNCQTFEETVIAALEKIFQTTPLYITVPPENLSFMYLNTGKTVADVIGPVRSARLEVIR